MFRLKTAFLPAIARHQRTASISTAVHPLHPRMSWHLTLSESHDALQPSILWIYVCSANKTLHWLASQPAFKCAPVEADFTTTTPSPSLETEQSDATVRAQVKVTDCRTADSSSWTGASALSAPTTGLLIKARPWPTIIHRRKPLIVNFHTTLSDAWLSAELWTNALVLKPTKQNFNTLPLLWGASERKENIWLQLLQCQWGSRCEHFFKIFSP